MCFYTDFKVAQIRPVEDFLEYVLKESKLQKSSINMICLNSKPSEHSKALVDKYSSIAEFWAAGAKARPTISEFNMEEPNLVIIADTNGKLDYIGNLLDSDCRTNFAAIINKGTSKKPNNFLFNLSNYSKYYRKFSHKVKPETYIYMINLGLTKNPSI